MFTSRRTLTAVYIGQFLFLGVQLPFLPGWLDHRGFSPAAIGALVGISLILRLVLAPVIAYRAETLADPRLGVRWATGLLFLTASAMVLPISNGVLAVLVVSLLFLFGLMVPLTDTALLRADRRGELAYGPVRGIGSASFIVANLIGGAVILNVGDQAAVWWMAATAGLTALAVMVLPREPARDVSKEERPNLRQALALFRSRSFLLMLFAGGLVQGSHAVYYSFSELHWSALGYSSQLIGILWAIGVLTEIGLLVAARQVFARIGPAQLILLGALAAVLRWVVTGMSPPLGVLIGLQALHAFTFAATYLGCIEFIGRAVPTAYRTTAITLVSTLGVGAMTGIATVAAGGIFDRHAPLPSFILMSGMGVVGVVLAYGLLRRWDGGALRAVD